MKKIPTYLNEIIKAIIHSDYVNFILHWINLSKINGFKFNK